MEKISFNYRVTAMPGENPDKQTEMESTYISLVPATLMGQIDVLIALLALKVNMALWQGLSINLGGGKTNDLTVSLIIQSDDARFCFKQRMCNKFSRETIDKMQEKSFSISPALNKDLAKLRGALCYYIISSEKFRSLSVATATDNEQSPNNSGRR